MRQHFRQNFLRQCNSFSADHEKRAHFSLQVESRACLQKTLCASPFTILAPEELSFLVYLWQEMSKGRSSHGYAIVPKRNTEKDDRAEDVWTWLQTLFLAIFLSKLSK